MILHLPKLKLRVAIELLGWARVELEGYKNKSHQIIAGVRRIHDLTCGSSKDRILDLIKNFSLGELPSKFTFLDII